MVTFQLPTAVSEVVSLYPLQHLRLICAFFLFFFFFLVLVLVQWHFEQDRASLVR